MNVTSQVSQHFARGNMVRIFALFTLALFSVSSTLADSIVSGSVGVGIKRYVDGLDLSDGQLTSDLNLAWNHDSGFYSNLSCFATGADNGRGIKDGCELRSGVFLPIGDEDATRALEFSLIRHEYDNAPDLVRDFSFTAAQIDFHLNQNTRISANFTDKWFGGCQTTILLLRQSFDLSSNLQLKFDGSLLFFEEIAPIDDLQYAEVSLHYQKDRWSASGHLWLNDDKLEALTHFSVPKQDVGIKLNYQFY